MDEEILENEKSAESESIEIKEASSENDALEENAKTAEGEQPNSEEPSTDTEPSLKSDSQEIIPEPSAKENSENGDESELISLRAELERERKKRIESEKRIMAIEILEKRGLPRSLSTLIANESEEQMEQRADTIAEIIRDTVNCEIAKRLSALPAPQKSKDALSKSAFKSMSLDEMQRLYRSDKTLYLELARK